MCHWLTVAAADRTVLAPLREFGAALAPAEFPALPPTYEHLQRYLVASNGCSCSLMRRENHEALAAALTTARLVGGTMLVHHTFGDEPRGQRRLGPTEPRDAAAFLAGGGAVDDRWILLTARWRPEAPLPRTLDGGRVVAVAVHGSDDEPRALFAVVEHAYVPGCSLLRCDAEWTVLAQEWHADAAAARTAAAVAAGSTLRWRDADGAAGHPQP